MPKLTRRNPLRLDPSRTLALRAQFQKDLRRRFARLRRAVYQLIVEEDALGLGAQTHTISKLTRPPRMQKLAANAGRWQFQSDPEKVKQFKGWLEQETRKLLPGQDVWETFAEQGFRKGAARAFDDVRRRASEPVAKEEFLRTSFGRPVAKEKVQLLAGRSFEDGETVTATMSNRMVRSLADGLVRGQSPREIARTMSKETDLALSRMETVARTEIVRTHAEGQLEAMAQLGVQEVGVMVEWLTAEGACESCASMEGVVLTLEEAAGMLPRHPNCRCAWTPANVGEDTEEQTRSKSGIEAAIARSVRKGDEEENGEWGPGTKISGDRPTRNARGWDGAALMEWARRIPSTLNAFCPTGPGGGQDNSCSPRGGSAGAEAGLRSAEGLSSDQRKLYAASHKHVVAKMTPAAKERFEANTGDFKFYATTEELGQALAAKSPKLKQLLVKGASISGAYSQDSGDMHLDGHGKSQHPTEVYAHEYGHAIDGKRGSKISDTDEWQSAWRKEIAGGQLSKYGATTPAEGFAEFSRAVLTGKVSKEKLHKMFPRASKVWADRGLM